MSERTISQRRIWAAPLALLAGVAVLAAQFYTSRVTQPFATGPWRLAAYRDSSGSLVPGIVNLIAGGCSDLQPVVLLGDTGPLLMGSEQRTTR
jgi:hypothetical protein